MLIGLSREYASTKIQANSHKNKALSTAQDILNFLNIEYSNKLSSGDISEKFEGNFDYLNRCFKKMTGHTIFAYINLIRINKAKELILTTHMHFGEIGYLVGIENPYYFSRLFKKIVGITPTDYYNDHVT
jgi:YesN/AraC family two-component response regulator